MLDCSLRHPRSNSLLSRVFYHIADYLYMHGGQRLQFEIELGAQ